MRIKLLINILFALTLVNTHTAFSQEPIWDGNKVVLISEKLDNGLYAYYSGEAKAKESKGFPVAMLVSIPPKYAVAQIVGYIKGKSAINIARNFVGRRKNYTGQHFWARGYHVSTVGRDEEAIRKYIKEQELEDRRIDQLQLFD